MYLAQKYLPEHYYHDNNEVLHSEHSNVHLVSISFEHMDSNILKYFCVAFANSTWTLKNWYTASDKDFNNIKKLWASQVLLKYHI